MLAAVIAEGGMRAEMDQGLRAVGQAIRLQDGEKALVGVSAIELG